MLNEPKELELLKSDPKKFFSRSFEVEAKIKFLRKRLATWEARATSITALISDEPKAKQPANDKTEVIMAEIVDLKADISAELIVQSNIEKQIDFVIKAMVSDGWAKAVMERRYLLLESWGAIARELGFSERWIYQLHGRALAEVKDRTTVAKL